MKHPDPAAAAKRGSRGTLEIRGLAGTSVSVFASAPAPTAPPKIFEGQLPASGRLRLRVPLGTLRVLAGTREATVDFTSSASHQRVDAHP